MKSRKNCHHGLISSLLLFFIAICSVSYSQEPMPREELQIQSRIALPEALKSIRDAQQLLAIRDGAQILTNDLAYPRRSTSTMRGVPDEIGNRQIKDQYDLNETIPDLYKYYGFTGSETLRFESEGGGLFGDHIYYYRQYINNIPTARLLKISVDLDTGRIVELQGNLEINQSFPTEAALNESEAISAVRDFLSSTGKLAYRQNVAEGRLFYRAAGDDKSLAPWWIIAITPVPIGSSDGALEFFVDPEGNVSEAVLKRNADVVVCDGSTQIGDFCSDTANNPTVIYANGSCNSAYTCPPEAKYQMARDEANKVQQMWIDVTGAAVNVGPANADYGGTVDINVGGDTGGDPGVTGVHPTGTGAAIIIRGDASASTVWHEMGHMAHIRYSRQTYVLDETSLPAILQAEHRAVVEYIGEITKVVTLQYNGSSSPVLNPTVNWGYWNNNYSVQWNHSDMNTSATDYTNARVGGHVFYELVLDVGVELAAKAFFLSIPKLDDTNQNDGLSWSEAREAMLEAAADIGNPTLTDAVKDAWFDVGIGASSAGTPNAPTDSGQYSPPVPFGIFANFLFCDAGKSVYDLYHYVSGAYDYDLWYSHNGSAFNTFGYSISSPTRIFTAADGVVVKVSACNNFSCSASSESESVPDICP